MADAMSTRETRAKTTYTYLQNATSDEAQCVGM